MKKYLTVLAVLLVAGLVGAYPAMAVGILDGKSFTGQIGNKGQQSGAADVFLFKDGKFESTLCSTFGYKQSPYDATNKGDWVNFQAQCSNGSGGQKSWNGTVKGDKIEGTVSNLENGKSSESWFSGILKK